MYFTTVSQTQLAIGNFHSVSCQSRSWRLTSQYDDKSNKLNLCLHLSLVKPHICLSWISNMTAVPQRKGEGSPVGTMMQGGKVLAVMLAYKTCYGIFWYRKIILEKKISRKNPEGKGKSYEEASCAGECDPEILGYGQSLDCCHLMEENASLVPKEKPSEHVYSQLKTSESSLQAICVDCHYLQRKLHANFLQTNCNRIKKALDFYLHLAGNIPSHKPLVLRYWQHHQSICRNWNNHCLIH